MERPLGRDLMTFLFEVVITGALALLNSCSSGQSQGEPTSTIEAMIAGIEWPDKYHAFADPNGFTASVSVTCDYQRTGIYLWALAKHRMDVAQEGQTYNTDTVIEFDDYGMHEITLPYYAGSDGVGVYELIVGLCEWDDDALDKKKAIEWNIYQFFVGNNYQDYLDVDVEYHYQENCRIYSGVFSFKNMTVYAYKQPLVAFNFQDGHDELPIQSIAYSPDAFLTYREEHGQ